MTTLDRRRFLTALAGSVVAAGAVLPMGFPKEPTRWVYYADGLWFNPLYDVASHQAALRTKYGSWP